MMEIRARRMYRLVKALCNHQAESEDDLDRAGTGTEAGQVTSRVQLLVLILTP